MIQLRPETKTLIFIGSGGVGKTTLSASVAVGEALRGKKVLVLTIDPSQRLAQVLDLKLDGKIYPVKIPNCSGSLYSCVINHKQAFEDFIRQAAQEKATDVEIDRLLKNKLYQQLSGQLGGSQEFTSLITLYQNVQSNKFDLVILDTPPSQHTWNFLRAPEKIASLFHEGVAKWFRDPDSKDSGLLKKLINTSTTQVLKALEYLTGSEFIHALSDFFKAIQKWQGPLEAYVLNCHNLLTSTQTEFVIVTGLDHSRIVEAEKISMEIKKEGYQLTTVVINRVPEWIKEPKPKNSTRVADIYAFYTNLMTELHQRITHFTKALNVYISSEFNQDTNHIEQLKKSDQNIILIKSR